MVDPLSAMLAQYVVPAVATPAGAITAGVIILAMVNNPKSIKYVLIAVGALLLLISGIFNQGIWILAILLFILYLVLKRK